MGFKWAWSGHPKRRKTGHHCSIHWEGNNYQPANVNGDATPSVNGLTKGCSKETMPSGVA
jgi:hypothetical protein